MKLLFCPIVVALAACATITPHPKPADMSESPPTPGTSIITGDALKQTGRIELPDALRASSPLFHRMRN